MIIAVDVDYRAGGAMVAGVSFSDWNDEVPVSIYRAKLDQVEDYEPGQFYKRELPCILTLLKQNNLAPDIIVIDGFVDLGEDCKPGLGRHLYNALNQAVAVIGVAKTAFKGSNANSEVYRGKSKKPLYVTAAGIEIETAKRHISTMHGTYRIPTLLKLADSECRKS